jgi:hypothetical protein
MGKSQYKKKIRHNPIRIPGTHLGSGKVDGKANPAKEQQMLPILGKVIFFSFRGDPRIESRDH